MSLISIYLRNYTGYPYMCLYTVGIYFLIITYYISPVSITKFFSFMSLKNVLHVLEMRPLLDTCFPN